MPSALARFVGRVKNVVKTRMEEQRKRSKEAKRKAAIRRKTARSTQQQKFVHRVVVDHMLLQDFHPGDSVHASIVSSEKIAAVSALLAAESLKEGEATGTVRTDGNDPLSNIVMDKDGDYVVVLDDDDDEIVHRIRDRVSRTDLDNVRDNTRILLEKLKVPARMRPSRWGGKKKVYFHSITPTNTVHAPELKQDAIVDVGDPNAAEEDTVVVSDEVVDEGFATDDPPGAGTPEVEDTVGREQEDDIVQDSPKLTKLHAKDLEETSELEETDIPTDESNGCDRETEDTVDPDRVLEDSPVAEINTEDSEETASTPDENRGGDKEIVDRLSSDHILQYSPVVKVGANNVREITEGRDVDLMGIHGRESLASKAYNGTNRVDSLDRETTALMELWPFVACLFLVAFSVRVFVLSKKKFGGDEIQQVSKAVFQNKEPAVVSTPSTLASPESIGSIKEEITMAPCSIVFDERTTIEQDRSANDEKSTSMLNLGFVVHERGLPGLVDRDDFEERNIDTPAVQYADRSSPRVRNVGPAEERKKEQLLDDDGEIHEIQQGSKAAFQNKEPAVVSTPSTLASFESVFSIKEGITVAPCSIVFDERSIEKDKSAHAEKSTGMLNLGFAVRERGLPGLVDRDGFEERNIDTPAVQYACSSSPKVRNIDLAEERKKEQLLDDDGEIHDVLQRAVRDLENVDLFSPELTDVVRGLGPIVQQTSEFVPNIPVLDSIGAFALDTGFNVFRFGYTLVHQEEEEDGSLPGGPSTKCLADIQED